MKQRKSRDIGFVFFLLAALVICLLATIYSLRDIQRNSYLERSKSINIVMNKIGNHLNIAIENEWSKLGALTRRIELLEDPSMEELFDTLSRIEKETGADFKVVNASGIAFFADGTHEYWKDHGAVSTSGESFLLSSMQFGVTNENYMKYIRPLDTPIVVDGERIAYGVLTEPLSSMSKHFNTSTFGDNCLSFVINGDGAYIYENGSNDLMADSYNLLAYLERNVRFMYDETFEHFKENLKNGVNDTALIEYNGHNYYLSYFNLEVDDWVSVMLVPESNIEVEGLGFMPRFILDIAMVAISVLLVFVVSLFYAWKKTTEKQQLAVEAERRSNEAKTNFLSSMSHDIRTPMNAIVGMTEIALHRKEELPRSVRDNLEKIRLSSSHLLTLINDILDISKIESGKMPLNVAEFSLVEVADTLVNLIYPQAKRKNIELRVHTRNIFQEHMRGDELRINQICINLAGNAIKYTPEGGRVDIDFIQEALPESPDKLRLSCIVRDNGIGISEEFQQVMYESFSRATDSRVNKVSGTGLGLTICKQIVQLMDGTLECKSAPGHGTVFTASVILEKGKEDENYELPDARILFLDSDISGNADNRNGFKRLGLTVDIVNDSSALGLLLEQGIQYKAAFVDLCAPMNTGISVVWTLRSHFGADFPIILTDIADMSEYAEEIESAGVTLTLSKPYFYRTVAQALRKALGLESTGESETAGLPEVSIAGMNVLVAEDNDLNWEILNEILDMNGVVARRAENGEQCVSMLEQAKPFEYNAVLMDVRMPVMDGREATRIIRKSETEWIRSIPIIAMTADAFAEDIHECLEAGMDAHLSKPVNLNKLLTTLYNIMNNVPLSGGAQALNRIILQ